MNGRSFWLLCLLVGCSSEDGLGESGTGNVRFTLYGEDFIEQGIPASEFADGWSASFESFAIVLGDVTIAKQGGADATGVAGLQLFDLVAPGPHDVGAIDGLESGAWDAVGYAIAPISADTPLHASATAATRDLVQTAGASVLVRGSASKAGITKSFEWAFSDALVFGDCVAEQDGKTTPGFSLGNGSNETVELTIHGDHLFYDDLASPDAVLRFDAMARADDEGDADGDVTLAELAQVPLATLTQGTYGTGSASHVDDLGAFVAAQIATLGHFRGEGHCIAEVK